jgi:hypothetical protein
VGRFAAVPLPAPATPEADQVPSLIPTSLRFIAVCALLASSAACADTTGSERENRQGVVWRAGPALPQPITNNAVAAIESDLGVAVFSFLGLDSTKVWDGITNAAYRWDVGSDAWITVAEVPGPGRLASTAQVIDGLIYLIGGYTVAADGQERSVPDVNVYDPASDSWSRGANIPLPTDDAVAGVWGDTAVVLVSGWHDDGNVPDVQIYYPSTDRWTSSTPIPGTPVFGHTGAVAGNSIIYVDGAAVVDDDPRFAIDRSSWRGDLSAGAIEWRSLGDHPGPVLYRGAGGTVGTLAVFLGGSENPYNYNGIGYDGNPSDPVRQVLAYSPASGEWRHLAAPPLPSMDHRNLGVAGGNVFLVGGMHEGQEVTDNVWYAAAEALLASIF